MSGISPILSADIPARSGMPTDPNLHEGYGDALNAIEGINKAKRRIINSFDTAEKEYSNIINRRNTDSIKVIDRYGMRATFGEASRIFKSLREKRSTDPNATWLDFKDKLELISEKLSEADAAGKIQINSELYKLQISMNNITTNLRQLPQPSLFIN